MKTEIILLGLISLLSLGCDQAETTNAQYKSDSLSAEAANEGSAAPRHKPDTLQETQTERQDKQAARPVMTQSDIINDSIREHLHAKTGFTPGKEITGAFTQADLARVTGLDFSFSKIDDAGLKEVVIKLPNMTYLSFWRVRTISDTGLKELVKLKKITSINLDGTQVTDAGLPELAKIKQLKEIDLENTKGVTEAGIDALQQALPNCKILQGKGS
jgi:hypothetical protein